MTFSEKYWTPCYCFIKSWVFPLGLCDFSVSVMFYFQRKWISVTPDMRGTQNSTADK